jgi:hypothetical protein
MRYTPSEEFLLGRQWLDDAKTDLDLSKSQASVKDEGVKRRRLFILQQSLEKLVKSSFPVFSRILEDFATMISIGLALRGNYVFDDEKYRELTADLKSHLEKFADRKDLKHNPAKELDLKRLLEKLIEFAKYIGFDEDTTKSLSELPSMPGRDSEDDLLKHSLSAYAVATTRGKLLTLYLQNRAPPSDRYREGG